VSLVPGPAITLAAGLPPLPLVAAGIVLLFLPGYAVASVLLRAPRYSGVERLLAAPALTLAALALLTLWATTLHLPLGPPAAAVLLAASLPVVALPALTRGRPSWAGATSRTAGKAPAPLTITPDMLAALGYGALFLLALALRLWSTRGILPTLGADTYHHTLIARLIVERAGLPDSYAPYAPIQSFAYHFGFHNVVAWLHWWTGADVGPLVGLAGHLVNAAVALGVAFFVLRTTGDGLVAGLTAWLVALLAVFPAYLENWGRYTQAAGLVLLPVAAALCLDAVLNIQVADPISGTEHRRGANAQPTLAAGLAASGLLLAHYRMAAMLVLLVAVWLFYLTTKRLLGGPIHPDWGARVREADQVAWDQPLPYRDYRATGDKTLAYRERPPWSALARGAAGSVLWLGGATVVAGLLALPWLVRLRSALSLGLGQQPGDYGADYYGLERLGTAVTQPTNLPLLALAALGLLLAWRLRGPMSRDGSATAKLDGGLHRAAGATPLARCAWAPAAVLALGAWALAQLALANPRWWPIPMPLAGRVDLVTTIAALCFPLGVAAALALAVAARVAVRQWGGRGLALALLLGLGATVLGGWQLQTLVTPANALVAPADLAAAAWLQSHTPADARIAVSSVIFPWAPDYVVGVDAGYWLPLLAGRATTVLPMLYPGERGADPRAVGAMVAIARALRDAPADPRTAALLRSNGVGYVYHSGRAPLPSADALGRNPALRPVYDQGGVRIWAVTAE